MPITYSVIIGFVLFTCGLLVFFLAARSWTVDEMSHRLQEFVSEQPAQVSRVTTPTNVRRSELQGSFRSRVLVPWFKRLGGFFGRLMPARTLGELGRQLAIAGNPLNLGAREFYGLRILIIVLGAWLAILVLRRGAALLNLLLFVLILYVAFFLPRMWLRRIVRRRQDRIRKGLPDALDMLSVCVEAGLGFDQSLQRITEYWKTPLSAEFGRVVSEMEMGLSRQEAMRNLSNRLDVMELSSFVAVIIQSDQLGMSIADTLRSQAEQMRIERRFRAQEQARKVPLKMLFPMIFFIFPAMLAVICGPLIPGFVEFFGTLRSGSP